MIVWKVSSPRTKHSASANDIFIEEKQIRTSSNVKPSTELKRMNMNITPKKTENEDKNCEMVDIMNEERYSIVDRNCIERILK